MFFALFVASTLLALGCMVFGEFEARTPLPRRISKLIFLLGSTALVAQLAGTAWALGWVGLLFGSGLSVHRWWTRRNGIDFLRPEPRAKYEALRGWNK